MILCILWHHHLQIEQVVPGRPFQFTLEQDGGFCIEAQGEQWVIHLSSTLCFMDSRRRSRKIRSQHDELCYLPFYQKLDLLPFFRPAAGKGMRGSGLCDECDALSSDNDVGDTGFF